MGARRFGLSVRLLLISLAAAGVGLALAAETRPWSGPGDQTDAAAVALDMLAIRAEIGRHGWPLPRSSAAMVDRLAMGMQNATRNRTQSVEADDAVRRLRNASSEDEARVALGRAEEVLGGEVGGERTPRPASAAWAPWSGGLPLGGLLIGFGAAAMWMLERRSRRRAVEALAHRDAEHLRLSAEFTALERTSMRLDGANRELGIENQRLREGEATLARRNALALDAMEAMHEGLATFDAAGRMVLSNKRFAAMYRLPKALAAQGTSARVLLRHWLRAGIFAARDGSDTPRLIARWNGGGRTYVVRLADGRILEVNIERKADGGRVTTHEDVTERQRGLERANHLAHHDGLTGLANRAAFSDRLEGALAESRAVDLIMFDLDRFKQVNDLHGHAAGDRLLVTIAARIGPLVAGRGLAARLGGDEFAILLDPPLAPGDLDGLAEQIAAEVRRPISFNGQRIDVGISGGVARAPQNAVEADELIRCADLALYEVKNLRLNAIRPFAPRMVAPTDVRRRLEQDLAGALAEDRLNLDYQPVVALDSGMTTAVEALLRWRHPLHGAVPAETIVRVAEETGTIGALTEWVLRASTLAAAALPDAVGLTINVSAVQLALPTLPHLLVSAIAGAGLAPSRLSLEVASTCLEDVAARRGLSAAAGLGVRIAIDRFDGRIALSPTADDIGISAVKLDRALIADIDADPDGRALLRSAVDVAQRAGLATIAVGIEAETEMRAAAEAGCVYAQGFHVAPPMSFEALAKRLDCRTTADAGAVSGRRIDLSLTDLLAGADIAALEDMHAGPAVRMATVA